MPISATAIRDAQMAALIALLDVAAKRGGPTEFDRGHDASLRRAQRRAMLGAIGGKRRLFPILLRGLSTVEDLRFSAPLRQIERSRGNGTIERNAGGERRCRQACKTHSFREPGMA
jgi:hypothetical protein